MKKYQVLFYLFILLPTFALGQRGLFSGLEENQKVLKRNFSIIYNTSSKLPLISNKELKLSQIKLSPEYLSWVFLNSKSQYIELFKPNDLCRFTELANNNLLNVTDRIIFEVRFPSESKDKKIEKKSYGFFKLDQLEKFLVKNNHCDQLKMREESFDDQNLAITISSYNLQKPKSEKECEEIIDRVRKDPMVTNFCGTAKEVFDADMAIINLDINAQDLNSSQRNALNKKIKRGVYIRNKVGDLESSLMVQICQNLKSPKIFCGPHLREDIWTKAKNGEYSLSKVKSICSKLIKSEAKNIKDLDKCAMIANDMPNACIDIVREQKKSLFPVLNCNQLSKALMNSRMETDYIDCPSETDNHLQINAQRIASNLRNLHEKYQNFTCKELPEKLYSNISYEFDSESWPLNICYFDPADAEDMKICYQDKFDQKCTSYTSDAPVESANSSKKVLERILKENFNNGIGVNCLFFEKEDLDKYLYSASQNCLVYHSKSNCTLLDCPKTILLNKKEISQVTFSKRELRCMPYIPGFDVENEISENRVISKIVRRIFSTPNSLECKIIPESRYNPVFLEYKQGCYILKPKNCSISNCTKRIIYNQQEFFNFKYTGKLGENYFEVSSQDKNHSMNKKLKKVLKFEDEKILSLTKLKLWFKNKKKIIHGTGCIEDLYPDFFRRTRFNQCTNIPFIISGYNSIDNTDYVIINTTADLASHPRIIRWNNLYNALKMYQSIHPQRIWALYGTE